jgi:Domain of unknown function (DUF4386)
MKVESGSAPRAGAGVYVHPRAGAGFRIGIVFLGLGSTVFSYLSFKSRYIPRDWPLGGIFSSLVLAIVTVAIFLPHALQQP